MKLAKLILVLAVLLLLPATAALADTPVPQDQPSLPSAEAPADAPPDAAEAPAQPSEDPLDVDLGELGPPDFQKRIRICTQQEAASIGCSFDCCIYIFPAPRCFC